MVYGVIRNVQAALKYRGGWKGLLEHMYTVSNDDVYSACEYSCFCVKYAGRTVPRLEVTIAQKNIRKSIL